MKQLLKFIGTEQMGAIVEALAGEESSWFKAVLASLGETIRTMPKVYEQDGKGDDAVAYLHYFKGGYDWYITERDFDEQLQAFGLACMHEDELGYISIQELIACGVELDLHFEPKILALIKHEREKAMV